MRSGQPNDSKANAKVSIVVAILKGELLTLPEEAKHHLNWPTTDPEILNHRDENGKTPLIHAIEYLVKQTPNTRDHAIALRQVNALLDAGADKTLTYNGRTPFEHLKNLITYSNNNNNNRKQHLTSAKVLLKRLKTKHNDNVKSLKPTDTTQRFILKLREQLGYQTDAGGLCNGYAHMAMQAFLVDPERGTGIAEFEARLTWAKKRGIENILNDLSKAKQKVKDAVQNNETLTKTEEMNLTENEKMALSVQAFYDGIELYQETDVLSRKNKHLFGDVKAVSQEAELAAPLAMSQALEEQGGLVTAYRGVGAFTSDGLVEYYTAIFNLDSRIPVSFTLSAANHAICVNYNPDTATFTLIDANDSVKTTPIQTFTHSPNSANKDEIFTKLADATKKAFFVAKPMESNEKIHLSTTMFARASDKDEALEAGKEFAEKLAPYSGFKKADLKNRDVTGRPLFEDIQKSGNKDAYASIKPKLSMTRRRIGVGLLAGLIITAGLALTLLTGGAALPVIIGGALAGLGVGTAAIAGFLPYLSSDPQKRLNQFAKTRGKVGDVLKLTEAPLTDEAKTKIAKEAETANKNLSSTATTLGAFAASNGEPTPKGWVGPGEQSAPETAAVAATPTASPSPTPTKRQHTDMTARYRQTPGPGRP